MSLINKQRYWQQLMDLAQVTDPEQPYTRRSFSQRFLQGRDWLVARFREAGLTVSVDAAGNLIGRKSGSRADAKTIMLGSHSDTVPSGGRFDGIAGVLAALECAQALQQHGIVLQHHLEIVDFLAEEPSEWGISCVGSRGISGCLSQTLLDTRHPESGETLADALRRMGGNPDTLHMRDDIAAFLELHIEQGRVLEDEGVQIGVVSGIVGIIRLALTLSGQAAHAGTAPMHARQDTLCAAAEIIAFAEQLAKETAARGEGYLVATCGQLANYPNASNVVSGETRLIFDIRADRRGLMDAYADTLAEAAGSIALRRGLRLDECARMTDTHPTLCHPSLMAHIRAACDEGGYRWRDMPSGAGHDAAFLCRIAPGAMVFVPCVDGKSHCPEEWTHEHDLSCGIDVLMRTLLRLDAAETIGA